VREAACDTLCLNVDASVINSIATAQLTFNGTMMKLANSSEEVSAMQTGVPAGSSMGKTSLKCDIGFWTLVATFHLVQHGMPPS
jgi:hypothetical protein